MSCHISSAATPPKLQNYTRALDHTHRRGPPSLAPPYHGPTLTPTPLPLRPKPSPHSIAHYTTNNAQDSARREHFAHDGLPCSTPTAVSRPNPATSSSSPWPNLHRTPYIPSRNKPTLHVLRPGLLLHPEQRIDHIPTVVRPVILYLPWRFLRPIQPLVHLH